MIRLRVRVRVRSPWTPVTYVTGVHGTRRSALDIAGAEIWRAAVWGAVTYVTAVRFQIAAGLRTRIDRDVINSIGLSLDIAGALARLSPAQGWRKCVKARSGGEREGSAARKGSGGGGTPH